MKVVPLILAGGKGLRLWPLSRSTKPKQFMNLMSGKTLLEETLERIPRSEYICPPLIVSLKEFEGLIIETLRNYSFELLNEPMSKNTAIAIGYAALYVNYRYPGSILAILPADHYIPDTDEFGRVFNASVHFAAKEKRIVLIGVEPRYPETEYGYIKFSRELIDEYQGNFLFRAIQFKEKPSFDIAETYVSQGDCLWNSGMFFIQTDYVLEQCKRFLPEVYEGLKKIEPFVAQKDQYSEKASDVFADISGISFDYGIVEKDPNVYMVRASFIWNDLGNWKSFLMIDPRKSNFTKSNNLIIKDTHDSVIYNSGNPNKLFVMIGLRDMVVVDSPDVLLVARTTDAKEIKEIVQELQVRNSPYK